MMAGGDCVETQRPRPLGQTVELEMPIAGDAWVGRLAPLVGGDVGIDDPAVEVLAEVEDVVLDPEPVRHPPGIVDVRHRTAALVRRTAPELQRHADRFVARGDQARRRRRRSRPLPTSPPEHATGPRCSRSHAACRRSLPAAAGNVAMAVATSARVEAQPMLSRSAPLPSFGVHPHGGEHMGELRRAAGAGGACCRVRRPPARRGTATPRSPHRARTRGRCPGPRSPPCRRARSPRDRAPPTASPASSSTFSAEVRPMVSPRVRSVSWAATAVATAPATFWVPERRSRSWPPPTSCGVRRTPSRTTSTPLPLGPPNLWADSEISWAG